MMVSIQEPIGLAVVGCDFRIASSRWRSRLVLDDAETRRFHSELVASGAVDGFVALETCNRSEWIISGGQPEWAAQLLSAQMKHRAGPGSEGWFEPYVWSGEPALLHLLQVAIGQESLVVGERQIAGQFHDALEHARTRGTSSRTLNSLGPVTGRLVRTATRRGWLGSSGRGVHGLGVSYLRHRLPASNDPTRVAVVGLGSIGRRVVGILESDPAFIPVPCNRTVSPEDDGKVRPLTHLGEVLAGVRAAIVCTGAPEPVVRAEHLSRAAELAAELETNPELLMLDIGIPEQVERAAGSSSVETAGLDELGSFFSKRAGERSRIDPADVDRLLEHAVEEFRLAVAGATLGEMLDTVKRHHRQVVQEEIPRLVAGKLGYLPESARTCLEHDLKSIILDYTGEVFRSIKETAVRSHDHPAPSGDERGRSDGESPSSPDGHADREET